MVDDLKIFQGPDFWDRYLTVNYGAPTWKPLFHSSSGLVPS